MTSVERTNTHTACLIIGAGHVGISVARGLRREGIDPVLLEQNAAIGDAWRHRYERLHLHHITDAMHLPGVKFPRHVNRFPSRLDLADYLEAYVALHDLDVRLNHRVLSVKADTGGGWLVDVETPDGQGVFTADQILLAAGATGITPRIPRLEGSDVWGGQILHSKAYVNAAPFENQRVLVVGTGNSAIEILCDLYDHNAKPSMLMRSANSWVTREGFAYYHHLLALGAKTLQYVPFTWLAAPLVMRALDRWLMFDVKRRYGDLAELGIQTDPTPPMLRMAKTRGAKAPSYIDGTWGNVGVSMVDLIRDGHVQTFTTEISHFEPGSNTVVFKDGSAADFDSVILCTGFEPVISHYATFLDPAIMESIQAEGFQPSAEIPRHPGLWIALGGLATSRYGLQVLAKRIAAKIQNRPAPGRVLNPFISFALAGPDPGLIQVPRRTILINIIAVALILYLAFA